MVAHWLGEDVGSHVSSSRKLLAQPSAECKVERQLIKHLMADHRKETYQDETYLKEEERVRGLNIDMHATTGLEQLEASSHPCSKETH